MAWIAFLQYIAYKFIVFTKFEHFYCFRNFLEHFRGNKNWNNWWWSDIEEPHWVLKFCLCKFGISYKNIFHFDFHLYLAIKLLAAVIGRNVLKTNLDETNLFFLKCIAFKKITTDMNIRDGICIWCTRLFYVLENLNLFLALEFLGEFIFQKK